MQETWKEFTDRFADGFDLHGGNFYAVIDKDGCWVDSAITFDTAIHWASLDYGSYDPEKSDAENLQALADAGYSIIHAQYLKDLWEIGKIK